VPKWNTLLPTEVKQTCVLKIQLKEVLSPNYHCKNFFHGKFKIKFTTTFPNTTMSLIRIIKKNYRKSRLKRWNRLYDRSHVTRVEKGLQVLANQGRKLSVGDSKKAEEYARTVLGSVDFAPWLKLYAAFRGEFLEGWIPDNYLGRIVCPSINGNLKSLGEYKTLSRKLLQTDALPDLVYRINGSWLLPTGEKTSLAQAKALCFDQNPYVFLKKDFSFQGNGVNKLKASDFDVFDFGKAGDFVIQSPIYQHPFLEEFSPGAVATLRITTVKPFGQSAKNHLCALRVGRKGMDFIYASDCIRIPLWADEGRFFPTATTADWKILEKHPDTGVSFDGKIIPYFQEAVQLCEALHDKNPHLQLIGWDAAIDVEGKVKLMEWNTNEPGIIFSESANGPHFKGLNWEGLSRNQGN